VSAPRATSITPAASPQEAAAIVAAIARFQADTAPIAAPATPVQSGWLAAARREAVSRDPRAISNL
jgi:hypothetical protein